jgi:hypothetical protein
LFFSFFLYANRIINFCGLHKALKYERDMMPLMMGPSVEEKGGKKRGKKKEKKLR